MKTNKENHQRKPILYNYSVLEKEIMDIARNHDFVDVSVAGHSVENRKIYILKFGTGPRKILICGGTHASEWITVPVLMKWIREIGALYISKDTAYNKSIEELFERSTIHILPMLNPDGIELQINGIAPGDPREETLIQWNNGSRDFSKWKANIRGVDINRNFDAKWETCLALSKEAGITGPWSQMYGGKYPESEPETQAIANYTRQGDFDLVLSYHTQGREIYWSYDGIDVKGARRLGEKFSKASGYVLEEPDVSASHGGYKDWFIKAFKRPGYTIECGLGENPLPMTQFDQIYKENFQLLLIAAWGD